MLDKERIEEVERISGLKGNALANRIGGFHQMIKDIKAGRSSISGKLALAISRNLHQFSIEWLISGEGEVSPSSIANSDSKSLNRVNDGIIEVPQFILEELTLNNRYLREKLEVEQAATKEIMETIISRIESIEKEKRNALSATRGANAG